MTYANEVAAVVALVLQMLLLRGFLPHVRVSRNTATALLAKAIFVASAVATMRLTYYDIWRPLGRAMAWVDLPAMSLQSQLANAGFNAALAVASVYALRALHAALPSKDRAAYNWLTAPFYPSRCILIFRRD